jgi:general nucleoside transport system permease protein
VAAAPSRSAPRRLLLGAGQAAAAAGGLIVLVALTMAALSIPPVAAMQAIWAGAVGTAQTGTLGPLSTTLTKMAPLLLTGLSVVVAWRAGMFSIGAEGQLLIGALAALAFWSVAGSLPPLAAVVMMIALGTAAGAIWSGIAAWLRIHRNVPEVISTIMLNYIALNLIGALVTAPGPLHGKTQAGPHSDPLPDAISLPNLVPPVHSGIQAHVHLGVAIALLVAPLVALYLYRTVNGYRLRVVGQNGEAARTARMPIDRLRMEAMLVSGALSGLAGTLELLGVTGRLGRDFSPGWGYTAIPVALLGGLSPGGVMLSALFFGGLAAGCNNAQRTAGVPSVVAYVIQAATVLAIVAARAWRNRRAGVETD